VKITRYYNIRRRSCNIEEAGAEWIAIAFQPNPLLNRAQGGDYLPMPDVIVSAIIDKWAGVDWHHTRVV
jgi:hypothetical protein